MVSRLSHREKLSAAASALKENNPNAAAIALEKAERRIDALEIVVRKLAKDAKLDVTAFASQATRTDWPHRELQDLLS
jgi:hypothetical protein